MATAISPPRREHGARWMALGGATCALVLAVLAGVCAPHAVAPEPTRAPVARRAPIASTLPSRNAVSAPVAGPYEGLVGVHEPSVPGQLELPRPTRQPVPSHPRFTPRHALAPRLETPLALRLKSRLWRRVPEVHGRVADRPIVATCPAQGPPRTA